MKENKDIPEIRDDEIRVIGDSQSGENKNGRAWWWILAAVVLAAGIVSAVLLVREPGNAADRDEQEQEVVRGFYEQEEMVDSVQSAPAYVEVEEQIAKGRTKLGWCAIIDGNISIGYDKEPAALQEAILSGGYFFRQYGLIADGKYVKESSRWKYSSRRRALCLKDGQDFIVETLEAETFPRFSYVLEDLNVDAAIYLVGGDSYAYGRDRDGDKIASGIFDPDAIMDNTSYILWKY